MYAGRFPILGPDQSNPVLTGAKSMQDLIAKQLMNQQMRAQNEFLPQSLQEQLQSKQLANELSRINLNTAPEMNDARLSALQAQTPYTNSMTDLNRAKTAQTDMYTKNPLLGGGGMGGQLAALLYLQQHPELVGKMGMPGGGQPAPQQGGSDVMQTPSIPQIGAPAIQAPGQQQSNMPGGQSTNSPTNGIVDTIANSLMANVNKQKAQADNLNKRTQGYNYQTLPLAQKSALLAQASGMGYDPQEATQQFINGKTVKDLAEAKGFSPNNLPDPIYPTTPTALTQIQRRQQSLTEINTLNPILTSALAPYSERFSGYSPKQIAQSLSGEDPDAQAKFLAARALTPEMSSLRLKAMGGQVGIEALREVTNASMGNLRAFQSLINPSVYQKSNEYMDQWINQAVTSANKVGLRPGLAGQNSPAAPAKNSFSSNFSQEDLEHTAKKYNMSAAEVKRRLGME